MPACAALASAPAQRIHPGAAAEPTREHPSFHESSAPAAFEWDDWQPDAGDAATVWGPAAHISPAQWDQDEGQRPQGPGAGVVADMATHPDHQDGGEEEAAGAAEDAPRLVQYKSTSKGILVDR